MILFGILFLIFFQLLTDFIEAIYAFGLLGTSIPPEIAAVLFLFTPVLLILIPRGLSGRALIWLGELVLLCRVVEPALDTRGRMLAAGLGVGLFLIFFPALLWQASQRRDTARGRALSAGLALGVSLSILLRASNSGLDLSLEPGFQWTGWVLAGAAAVLLPGAIGAGSNRKRSDLPRPARAQEANKEHPSSPVVLPALGITSVFILIFFAFTAPNVIARWTASSYPLIITLLGLALALFAILIASGSAGIFIQPRLFSRLPPILLWIWNLLFISALVLTILLHQVRFPAGPGSYPLPEPPASPLALAALAAMLLLSPVLLLDFFHFVQRLTAAPLSLRALGVGFTLSSLYLLLMIFAQVFTTVYDYIPVVGPFFRDKFCLAFLVPGIVLVLGVIRWIPHPTASPNFSVPWGFAALICLAALFSIAGVLLTSPRPAPPPEENRLRVLTYNIQQGYSAGGQRSFAGQLDLIRQVDAGLIGLQESDTNRIAGGNADLVRYFADRLDLYSTYGPKTVASTFGIALLSKYPLQNPRTFYMYSAGEQTAAIAAQVQAAGRTFNVYVTHLGNGGPMVQQQQFLEGIDGRTDVIAMGDFNFEPDTEQYRLTTRRLADAWLSKWPSGVDGEGYHPIDRIDHIFLSPDLEVQDARHLTGPQSDHPAVWVEVVW